MHKHLRAWRKASGLTLERLENIIGSKTNTISGWETGSRTVDLDDLKKLADAYGVHPAALLFSPPGGAGFESLRTADALIKNMDEDSAKLWFEMGKKLTRASA